MEIREMTEELEGRLLSPFAAKSGRSRGREREEEPCPVRTSFQRDRDRIVHSKAFRRLQGKTQVFIIPTGDHYRNRLTHTLEVAQIARTIAKALRLNDDLTEAIALGHDLGHTPFGHAGERVLNELCSGGFRHNEQSLRVVEVLEQGTGLNLTWEVRDGILNHTGPIWPATLEGQAVRQADRVAYINHDLDDALRGGILQLADVPTNLLKTLGYTHSQRINTLVRDIIVSSWGQREVKLSPGLREVADGLRQFLFDRVYVGSLAKKEETKAMRVVEQLYLFYLKNPEELESRSPDWPQEVAVLDYVSGMTDRFALLKFREYFLPEPWSSAE
ncbi:MAG: deoxyguanosinetriphosphate triphosphohydrolase [Firmicutes bacterium]|nr:deoxyguanosinetriphosphate triphosphohydrolase [Bacillota bacterium]MCL5039400.1 deoxyguanosinetriphosphate triphosphohydrolase [Bacillota bacterium]